MVTGEAILGADISVISLPVSAISLADVPVRMKKTLRKAREIAFEELGSQARALGADAVVGIDIDYERSGKTAVC
ncbi:heavy metal-binding domain-containing protein [Shigella boydii]